MKILRYLKDLKQQFRRPVLAIGVFDGLHQGHQKLMERTVARARAIGGTPVVMTFDPHPVHVLHPSRPLPMITSLSYRLALFSRLGIKACVVVRFSRRFASMNPETFIDRYICRGLGAREVVVGDDFFFGRHRRGNAELLRIIGQKKGFVVHVIPTREHGQKRASSSKIRSLIQAGDIRHAQDLLARPVAISGRVIHGDHRGRTLGFPTANLDTKDVGLVPIGVYCVRVVIGSAAYQGIANIGRRPSFKQGDPVSIEVHLFNFSKTIYGRPIVVEFLKRIRSENVFPDEGALIAQLHRDVKVAREWFVSHPASPRC